MYGEILCNREVQLTIEASTCVTLLPLILGFGVMLLCMHWQVAALHATATCWHPELSVLSHTPCKCHELVTCVIILTD